MTRGFRALHLPGTLRFHPISWSIMKTSTIFAICGIVCGLTAVSLGFAGKPWQAGLFGLAAGIWNIATLIMERRGGDDD